ncbi:MAG: formate dehydrogenase [Desulfobacterales bacterium]|nr:formate dehydrogenase [Desulfobacterales bacterium]
MVKTAKIDVKDQDLLGALRGFFKTVLKNDEISAILVPWRLPMKSMVMPTLITDPGRLDRADPLSPAFPMNAAKIVSRLTRKAPGGKVAAVMRPCEIRAFIELVKLKQGRAEDLVIIGVDCLGAYRNTDYFNWVGEDVEEATKKFCAGVLAGNGASMDGVDLAPACQVCETPTATGADIAVGLYGMDASGPISVQAQSKRGEALLPKLGLSKFEEPPARKKAVDALVALRTAARDEMFTETRAAVEDLEKLTGYLANCVNCYNCRVACPVCYCRECVFVTDVFDHEPSQYLRWADQKGVIKMPTDTVFYHITRLAHMSTACVGCGQCSNACPNDIPVMELFRATAQKTQAAFDYEPGRSLEEKPPLSEFREDEYQDVVGIN